MLLCKQIWQYRWQELLERDFLYKTVLLGPFIQFESLTINS